MKIVHITPAFYPSRGGVETHVLQLCRQLIKLGHQVTVVTGDGDQPSGSEDQQPANQQIQVIRLPIGNPKTTKISKLKVFREIKKHQELFETADIIQAHDVFWWLLPIWPKIKAKVFTTFHGWEGHYPVKTRAKLHRLLASKMSRRTVHVGDWIKDFYWDKPDAVAYGGVKIRSTHKLTAPRLTKSVLNCVFFGRLTKENEIEKYLELIKILQGEGYGYDVRMTWVGDGEYANQCSEFGKVTGMTGSYIQYLNTADLVFASSYLAILTAQERGNIVCSFYSNPLKKAYLDTFPGKKWLIISENPLKMANNINILLENPKKMLESIKKAQKFAQTQTWDKLAELYLKLWK